MGKNILESGQRLQKLIQNFLIFAQLEMVSADPAEMQKMRKKVTTRARATNFNRKNRIVYIWQELFFPD